MNLDRITSNPKRMNGQPCIRSLRLTVRRAIELLATYRDRQEFPELEYKDIQQALIFAASYLGDCIIELSDCDEREYRHFSDFALHKDGTQIACSPCR